MYDLPTATCNVNYWVMPLKPIKPINAQNIINATCFAFGINKERLLSKKRSAELVRPRFICMYVIRQKLKNLSLKAIGRLFNRDHTTVIHAIQTIESDLSVPSYREETNEMIRSVIELL